jgi:uncharacterized repeat protein (TIGR03803 family)
VLHNFAGGSADGGGPGGLVSANGVIYGKTFYGGNSDRGVLFKIAKDGSYSVPYHFDESAGMYLSDLLLFRDRFYGAATFGGASGSGTVFRLIVPLRVGSR